jgi:hypothetical protein
MSTFLALPAEMRHQILGLILPKTMNVKDGLKNPALPLHLTCRTMHEDINTLPQTRLHASLQHFSLWAWLANQDRRTIQHLAKVKTQYAIISYSSAGRPFDPEEERDGVVALLGRYFGRVVVVKFDHLTSVHSRHRMRHYLRIEVSVGEAKE